MDLILTGALILAAALIVALLLRKLLPEYGDIAALIMLLLAVIAIARVAGVF